MEFDCKSKRGRFIESSLSIRETFKFAQPSEILKAVQVYCCDMYGSMLWNIYGDEAGKYFRCWNTCTKLVWDLPRQTHTYFVDNLLSCDYSSTRSQVLGRYVKFVRSLLSSPSKEVAVVARVAGMDARSNMGANILNIRLETRMCPVTTPVCQLKELFQKKSTIPERDHWRIPLLKQYVNIRDDQRTSLASSEFIDTLIENLCTT